MIRTHYALVALEPSQTIVIGDRAWLWGIYVDTVLSAHLVVISDGSQAVITLPASLAAGTLLEFPGVEFNTSIVVDPNASSTGDIVVFYSN